tara:strand:- start:3972 stop:4568 length:597 start_codon:yes stop_codon:yes gene_type:complete
MKNTPTIGWSDFALKHSTKESGNSYTTLTNDQVLDLVRQHWENAVPGDGETNCSRKILVTVKPNDFFLPPKVKLVEGLPVQAEVVKRQEHEDPYIETFVTPEDAAEFGYTGLAATIVKIVLYSAEALSENDGERSTGCEWEIVCILCSADGLEPMHPLTMARNYLEKEGGTKSTYSAREFAEAVYFYSNRGVRVRPRK